MTASPSGSNPDSPRDDNVDDLGDEELSGRAASDPEEARAAAEDALAQVEALADLDEEPEPESEGAEGAGPPDPSAQASGESGASASADTGTPEDQCENCGALLHGPYCSQCGQRAADRIVPIWHMVNEALEAVIELDMRVLWTLPKFLFLPGRLTKEYLNGRRKRYIRPFRLYLFTTFLLFTVLALTAGQGFRFPFDPGTGSAPADSVQANASTGVVDTTAVASAPSFMGSPEQRERWARQIRNNPNAVDVQFGDSETRSQLERLLRVKISDAIENPRDFIGNVIDKGPYVMFLMLPLFAFLLKLLYIRRGRLYVEHLIFSLHIHAFSFFAFTVGILFGETDVAWLNTAATWIELSPLLYLVLALGHVFDQGLIKSTIKAWLLLILYTIILSIGFVVLLLFAVVLM